MDKDKALEVFLERIKKKLNIEEVLLFGSRARGEEMLYSDYDIIVISEDFKGVKWHKRIEMLAIEWESDRDVDFLPYTREEFEKKKESGTIVTQAAKEAVKLL